MFGHSTISPPDGSKAESPLPPPPPPLPPVTPPGAPKPVDMLASDEMRAWLWRLEAADERIGRRNQYIVVALVAGVFLWAMVLLGIYRSTVASYAVIDDIEIVQHPVNPGRLQIKYRVVSPGRVHCRRTSGDSTTEVIDQFLAPGDVDRPWAWTYRPGQEIGVTLWYRSGLLRRSFHRSFPTPQRTDIVVLIDTTGSMEPSIAALRESCAAFSEQLGRQAFEHRLALIGFGDAGEADWLEQHPFTSDVAQFRGWVDGLRRFDGGDLPESALDALEEALRLPFDEQAVRSFFLVTDATFHAPTQSGATVEAIAARLLEARVILQVFSRQEFAADYAPLLGDTGHFGELESFGRALNEGRILED
jgi:hypothetical protein